MRPLLKVSEIIIHCSASMTMVTAEAIRKFHVEPRPRGRGFSDIGYHWVIPPNGNIETGRSEDLQGAHAYDGGHNVESIGICLGGIGGGSHPFEIIQLEAMRFWVRTRLTKYSLSVDNVRGHYESDTHGKTCPNLAMELVRAYIKGDSTWG